METKTVRLTSDMLKGVAYRAKMEDIDEYTAIRQLMKFGVMWYAVNLYKKGKITISQAAELSNVSVRKMLDILIYSLKHGKICIIDVSQMRGEPALILSSLVLQKIFDHNQQQFTEAKPETIPTIAVVEEAQAVLGSLRKIR